MSPRAGARTFLSLQTPQDIVTYPLVTSSAVPPRLARYEPTQKSEKISHSLISRWMPSVLVESISMMKDAERSSDGLTFLSLHLARHELERGEFKIVPISLSWIKMRFAVMYLPHCTLSRSQMH